MSAAPIRLAVFDCDGTLVDSQANIHRAMVDCFDTAGLVPPTRAETLRIVGLSVVEAIAALLPGHDAASHRTLGEAYKAAFHAQRARGQIDEPLYDGIVAAIAALAADGWRLAVATGKSDRGLALCLAHHGLTDHFVSLQTADRHPSKPHPSMLQQAMADAGATPGQTVMIGDTSFDIAMGRAAGVHTVGVGWGYHRPEELLAEGADRVVSDPSELATTLAALCRAAA